MTAEGDIVDGFQLGPLVAYQGKAGCTDPSCSHRYEQTPEGPRMVPGCGSYHCPTCDAPVSMVGHDCPLAEGGPK